MKITFIFEPETRDNDDIMLSLDPRDDIFDFVELTNVFTDDVDYRKCERAPDAVALQCVSAIYERNPKLAMTLIDQNPMLIFDARVAYTMYTNLSVLQAMFDLGLANYIPEYGDIKMPNGKDQAVDHDFIMTVARRLISHKECKAAKKAATELSLSNDYSGNLEEELIEQLSEDIEIESGMTVPYLCYYLANAFMKQEHFFYAVTFNVFMPIWTRDVLHRELGNIKSASKFLYPRQMDAFYQMRNQFRRAHAAQKQTSYQSFPILKEAIGNFVDFGLNKDLRSLSHVNVMEAPTGYGKTRTVMVAAMGDFVDAQAFDVPQRNMIVGTRTRSQVRAFLKESAALGLSALGVPSKTLSCGLRHKVIIPESPYWQDLLALSKDSVDKDTRKMLVSMPQGASAKVKEEMIDTFAGSDICKTCVFNPTNRRGLVNMKSRSQRILDRAFADGKLPGGLPIQLTQDAVDYLMQCETSNRMDLALSYLQAMYLDLDTAAEAFMVIFGMCGYRIAVGNLPMFRVLIVTYPYLFDRDISRYFRKWCQTDRVVTSHAVIIDEAHGLDKISSDETALNPNLIAKCMYYNEWLFHVQGLLGHKRSPLQQLFTLAYDAQEIADITSHTAIGYLRVLRHLEDTQHDINKQPIENVRGFFPSVDVIFQRLNHLTDQLKRLAFDLRNMSTSTQEAMQHGVLASMEGISNRIGYFLEQYMGKENDITQLRGAADMLMDECYPSGMPAYTHREFADAKELFSFLGDLKASLNNDMIKEERYKELSMSDIKMLSFTLHKIHNVFENLKLFYYYLLCAEGKPDSWIILVADKNTDWTFKKPFGKKLIKHLKRSVYSHQDRMIYHNAESQPGYTGTPFVLNPPGRQHMSKALEKMLDHPEKVGKVGKSFDEEEKDRYDWTFVPYRLKYPKMASTFLDRDAKAWKKMTGIRMELISNAAVLNAGFLGYNAIYLLSGTMPDNAYLKHFMGLTSYRTTVSKPLGEMKFIAGTGATTKYSERDQHYETYAQAILDIFCQRRIERPDRHVMVVFSSGQMLLEIFQRCYEFAPKMGLSRQDIITEKDAYYVQDHRLLEYGISPKFGEHNYMTINYFTEYLRERRADNDSTLAFVVAGGRYSEGIEFTFEGRTMIGTVACVGIPIPPPTPRMTALTQHLQEQGLNSWEIFELSSLQSAFQKIRQAIGRANRSDDDDSVIYLMDTRYANQSYWSRKLPSDTVIDMAQRREEPDTGTPNQTPYLKEQDIPF